MKRQISTRHWAYRIILPGLLCCALNAQGANPSNGGFESGLSGWWARQGIVSVSSDAYSGSQACRIEGADDPEGATNSPIFPVIGGQAYQLNSYVKQISGTGLYKVVIIWFDSVGRVIRYDNSWAGGNQPTVYTLHGGVFEAPADAVSCSIMIGVQSGTTCLFDDIELIVSQPPYLELDNGKLRIRMDTVQYGGAITYLSLSNQDRNIINTFDRGREIQQSYYAGQNLDRTADGQHSAWSPWPWNPIQVGDASGNSSAVIDSNITNGVAYTKTVPLLWDMNNEQAECHIEQWTSLHGDSVHVRCKLTCFRTDSIWTQVIAKHQELPAVYTIGDLSNLYTYIGSTPWQDQPLTRIVNDGPPWEYWTTNENWAATVDDSDWGLGVYNKNATLFAGGIHGTGSGGTSDSSTSYMTPLTTVALGKTTIYEYEYDLVVGSLDQIRNFAYMKNAGADLDKDGDVDNSDIAIFSAAWQSTPSEVNWNANCDIAGPGDIVDFIDFAVLSKYWMLN